MPPPAPVRTKILHSHQQHGPVTKAVASPKRKQSTVQQAANAKVPVTDYLEIQQNEVEALRSIYMEDFQEGQTKKGAWNSIAERTFQLRLKAFSDGEFAITLKVTLSISYPKTLPTLSIADYGDLRQNTRRQVDNVLQNKPKAMVGSEMIFEIASELQDILEDAVQSRAGALDLPSLEDERAVREAAAVELAKEQQEEGHRKHEEAKAEEEQMLDRMMTQELQRRQDQAREARRRSKAPALETDASLPEIDFPGQLTFDRAIARRDDDGKTYTFRAVYGKASVARGPISDVFTVLPALASQIGSTLILKEFRLVASRNDLKKDIQTLETELDALKLIRHPNVVDFLGFSLLQDGKAGLWRVQILTEYANKGSLCNLLQTVGTLSVVNVRPWTVQLLEATDFLHRHGVIHKAIHPNNIMLWMLPQQNSTIIKLADAAYQHHLYALNDRATTIVTAARSAYWLPPEHVQSESHARNAKGDIWDLAVVLLQMVFGLEVLQKHPSPRAAMSALDLSNSLEDLLRRMFASEARKRPTAFELLPCEFLRNDDPLLAQPSSPIDSRLSSAGFFELSRYPKYRRDSAGVANGKLSRYASDFVEAGRLGRGGFGEVVKARNKLDGRFYAIKKLSHESAAALTGILSEVMLLSRLNSPYIVRYYNAWEEFDAVQDEDAVSATEESSEAPKGELSFGFGQSASGLDYISSTGYPRIQFGYDSAEDDSDVGFDVGTSEGSGGHVVDRADSSELQESSQPSKVSSHAAQPVKATLYVQMEYCEKHVSVRSKYFSDFTDDPQTIRDLIREGLHDKVDEIWRLFRQILEGISHLHSNHVIHRDLKPDNIFIDGQNTVKIGDFGLSVQTYISDKALPGNDTTGDLSRSVGTTFYVAPELRSNVKGQYNEKVDMYSLGIILFEMCYPLRTNMERDQVLRGIREERHVMPSDFDMVNKATQSEIILSLISWRVSERPTSIELLKGGKLPALIEDDTIRQALRGISDPNSPYHQKMMSALFSQANEHGMVDYTWDFDSKSTEVPNDLLLKSLAKSKLTSIFRRHGAVETQRPLLLPRSDYYSSNVFQVLESSGTMLQLPYDLTLPNARIIAKQSPSSTKTYTFGNVYRETYTGGPPKEFGEVDFDLVANNSLDMALKEAEVIKVIDEVIDGFPALHSAQFCFHLNHSDLLELVLEFCRISAPQRPVVKEIISKLNIGVWSWPKIRNELRSPSLNIHNTSLDDLVRFDFRDTFDKAFQKLKTIFEGTEYLDRASSVLAHISAVGTYLKRFGITRKIYINPLSSLNEKFYRGGLLFQCLYDNKKRDVFAAGGRYDHLIRDFLPKSQGRALDRHAVGFNLGWERLVASLLRFQKTATKRFMKNSEGEYRGLWATRRCDVLVASFDPTALRSTGIQIVQGLWTNDISAELSIDAHSPDELVSHYKDDNHSWFVIIKQDSGDLGEKQLKVKSLDKKADFDIRSSELLGFLKNELRERHQREDTNERAKLHRRPSHPDTSAGLKEKEADVRVLVPQHKGKKSNRRNVVEAAQSRAQELVHSFLDGPIAAIEVKDDVLDSIRDTRLSDPDSWRKIIQNAPVAERKYLSQVHELISDMADEMKGTTRNAFIYNFRTGACIYYDLGRSTS
ncbi:MAG: hypothetical protein M1830_008699 [Pleopsidium flavum]|nr:MAG: hypothetical protein M1830_008699 [Pleopsidium flavum]